MLGYRGALLGSYQYQHVPRVGTGALRRESNKDNELIFSSDRPFSATPSKVSKMVLCAKEWAKLSKRFGFFIHYVWSVCVFNSTIGEAEFTIFCFLENFDVC